MVIVDSVLISNVANRPNVQDPSTETVCDLLDIILKNKNFEFDSKFYLQENGTAMGTRMAPPYANLFMGCFEKRALNATPYKCLVWWRYIDEIFFDLDSRARQTHRFHIHP